MSDGCVEVVCIWVILGFLSKVFVQGLLAQVLKGICVVSLVEEEPLRPIQEAS